MRACAFDSQHRRQRSINTRFHDDGKYWRKQSTCCALHPRQQWPSTARVHTSSQSNSRRVQRANCKWAGPEENFSRFSHLTHWCQMRRSQAPSRKRAPSSIEASPRAHQPLQDVHQPLQDVQFTLTVAPRRGPRAMRAASPEGLAPKKNGTVQPSSAEFPMSEPSPGTEVKEHANTVTSTSTGAAPSPVSAAPNKPSTTQPQQQQSTAPGQQSSAGSATSGEQLASLVRAWEAAARDAGAWVPPVNTDWLSLLE